MSNETAVKVIEANDAPIKHEHKHLIVFVHKNENLKFGVLSYLADNFEIYENRVTVLETESENPDVENKYAIVFRVRTDYDFAAQFSVVVAEKPFKFKCMQVHAKSKHKVYYTLNAMNELIRLETGSRDDRQHQLDWSRYEEQIIYLVRGELCSLKTKLVGVVNLYPVYDVDIDNNNQTTDEE